jgi:hypothetical protein
VKTATLTLTESFMRDAGVSAVVLARLTGVAPTSLRDALRGESYLGAEKELAFLKQLHSLPNLNRHWNLSICRKSGQIWMC